MYFQNPGQQGLLFVGCYDEIGPRLPLFVRPLLVHPVQYGAAAYSVSSGSPVQPYFFTCRDGQHACGVKRRIHLQQDGALKDDVGRFQRPAPSHKIPDYVRVDQMVDLFQQPCVVENPAGHRLRVQHTVTEDIGSQQCRQFFVQVLVLCIQLFGAGVGIVTGNAQGSKIFVT